MLFALKAVDHIGAGCIDWIGIRILKLLRLDTYKPACSYIRTFDVMRRLSIALNSQITFSASNVRHTLLAIQQIDQIHEIGSELVFHHESIGFTYLRICL